MTLDNLFDRLMAINVEYFEAKTKADAVTRIMEGELSSFYRKKNDGVAIERGKATYLLVAVVCRINVGMFFRDMVKSLLYDEIKVRVSFVFFREDKSLKRSQKEKINKEKHRLNNTYGPNAFDDESGLWKVLHYAVTYNNVKTVSFIFK